MQRVQVWSSARWIHSLNFEEKWKSTPLLGDLHLVLSFACENLGLPSIVDIFISYSYYIGNDDILIWIGTVVIKYGLQTRNWFLWGGLFFWHYFSTDDFATCRPFRLIIMNRLPSILSIVDVSKYFCELCHWMDLISLRIFAKDKLFANACYAMVDRMTIQLYKNIRQHNTHISNAILQSALKRETTRGPDRPLQTKMTFN